MCEYFALIRFLKTYDGLNDKVIVRSTSISNFNPINETDYDKSKSYIVKWPEPMRNDKEDCAIGDTSNSDEDYSGHSPKEFNCQILIMSVPPKYTEKNGKIFLGHGIWVDSEKWLCVSRQKSDSMFCKDASILLWGSEKLANRSIGGKVSKRKDLEPRPKLTPMKHQVMEDLFQDRINSESNDPKVRTARAKKMNSYIVEKIQDLNRAKKRILTSPCDNSSPASI